uniref:Uncharacterized protein n=1 Tax=Plectus sambesii TaxID=2011161 RepID=A0A914VXS5_9BILA
MECVEAYASRMHVAFACCVCKRRRAWGRHSDGDDAGLRPADTRPSGYGTETGTGVAAQLLARLWPEKPASTSDDDKEQRSTPDSVSGRCFVQMITVGWLAYYRNYSPLH